MLPDKLQDSIDSDTDSNNNLLNKGNAQDRRQISRKTDFIKKFTMLNKSTDLNKLKNENQGKKNIFLRFLKSPKEIILNQQNQITEVIFSKTKLVNGQAVSTEETMSIKCGLLFKSIGYKSNNIFTSNPNLIDFNSKSNIVVHKEGQLYQNGAISNKIYASGWLKTGSKGVIDSTLRDSLDTAATINQHIDQGLLESKMSDYEEIKNKIYKDNESNKDYRIIDLKDWQVIDNYEVNEGKKNGKIRQKVTSMKKVYDLLTHKC